MLGVILTVLIGVWCGVDLFAKHYVETHFEEGEERSACKGKVILRKVHNKGMALNLGEKHQKAVPLLSGTVVGILVLYYILLFRKKGKWLRKTGSALAIAGGVSNCYDRFTRKYVVDYFGFAVKWKKLKNITFNLGDFCIFLGGIFIVLAEVFQKKK